MAFTITPGVEVERDREGVVRQLQHLQVPYTVAEGLRATPEELAGQYLREVAPIYGIDSSWLTSLGTPPEDKLTAEGVMLHIAAVNPVMETTVVSYVETDLALPIWEAGVTVVAHNNPLRASRNLGCSSRVPPFCHFLRCRGTSSWVSTTSCPKSCSPYL